MRKKPDIKKRSQGRICLYEMFRISKYIQTESRLMVAKVWRQDELSKSSNRGLPAVKEVKVDL